jgi:hypothetical protein
LRRIRIALVAARPDVPASAEVAEDVHRGALDDGVQPAIGGLGIERGGAAQEDLHTLLDDVWASSRQRLWRWAVCSRASASLVAMR